MSDLNELFIGKLINGDKEPDVPECGMPEGLLPKEMPIGMMYVPYQTWEEPYEAETGLARGTVFPCLDKPFIGEEAVKRGDTK